MLVNKDKELHLLWKMKVLNIMTMVNEHLVLKPEILILVTFEPQKKMKMDGIYLQ